MKANLPAVVPPKKMGRPSIKTPDMLNELCQRIANGEAMSTVCESEHIASVPTVIRWLREDEDFQSDYAHAMQARGQRYGERVTQIAARVERGEIDPNAARVAIDGYKWAAARLAPKQYGDRIETRHTGDITATLVPIMPKAAG